MRKYIDKILIFTLAIILPVFAVLLYDTNSQKDVFAIENTENIVKSAQAMNVEDSQMVSIFAYYESIDLLGNSYYQLGNNGGSGHFDSYSSDIQSIQVENGQSINIVIDQNEGYNFAGGYLVDASFNIDQFFNEEPDYSATMSGESLMFNSGIVSGEDKVIYLLFNINRYSITLDYLGSLYVTGAQTNVLHGTEVTIDCQSIDENYRFYAWVDSDEQVVYSKQDGARQTFIVTKDIHLTAVSEVKVSLNYLGQDGSGKVYINSDKTNSQDYIKINSNILVTAEANTGFVFSGWNQTGYSQNPSSFQLHVSQPIILDAIFQSKNVSVSIINTNEQVIDISGSTDVNDNVYKVGDRINLSAIVKKDYVGLYNFNGWLKTASGSVNVDENGSYYIITPIDAENGSISFTTSVIHSKVKIDLTIYGSGKVHINNAIYTTGFVGNVDYSETIKLTLLFEQSYMYKLSQVKFTYEDGTIVDYFSQVHNSSMQFMPNQNLKINVVFEAIYWSDSDIVRMPQGDGTEESPYLIYTPQELAYISYKIRSNETYKNVRWNEAYIRVEEDLDFEGRFWLPIGEDHQNASYAEDYRFNGVLDLNNKTLKNIVLERKETGYYLGGLFSKGGIGRNGKIIHEVKSIWYIIGIGSSIIFGGALVFLVFVSRRSKKKRPKVVFLPKDLVN